MYQNDALTGAVKRKGRVDERASRRAGYMMDRGPRHTELAV